MSAERSPKLKPVTWAETPYGQNAVGNCVIQSSDNVLFKTQKLFLSYGSSVFAKSLQTPETQDVESEDEPILLLDEESATIRVLLDNLTPSGKLPQLTDIELAIEVVTACQKYSIAIERVNASIQSLVEQPENYTRGNKGLQVYALSWKMGLERPIKKASRYTHRYDLSDKKVVSTLIDLSGDVASLMALYDLRIRRTEAISTMLIKMKVQSHICSAHEQIRPGDEAVEMEAFRTKLATALAVAYPSCDKSFFAYLGMSGPKKPPSGGYNSSCKCFISMDEGAASRLLRKLVDEFPQEVDSNKFMKDTRRHPRFFSLENY